MKKIAIIGSINTDFTFKCKELPKPSETIHGESFSIQFGGKGANEAVSASRLGAEVVLFGKLGNDIFSKENLNNLQNEKLNTNFIEICSDVCGGSAGISIGSNTNSIIVVAGANGKVDIDYIERHKAEILSCDIFCLQLEIPLETVEYVINMLYENKKTIIFNPSPIIPIKEELLKKCSYVIVNEVEIEKLPNYQSEKQIICDYHGKLILTCGGDGVTYFNKEIKHIPSLDIKNIVDTTGAGDTFLASFAVALSEDKDIDEAIAFANTCAGLKITKAGAQTGMPYIKDVENFLSKK